MPTRTQHYIKRASLGKTESRLLPISELMRRGAIASETKMTDQDLTALADKAKEAAEQACVCIDDALAFIESSNRRIAQMEADARSGKAASWAALIEQGRH